MLGGEEEGEGDAKDTRHPKLGCIRKIVVMLLALLIGGILAGAVGVDCQEVQQKSHVSCGSTPNGSATDSVTCLCLVIF